MAGENTKNVLLVIPTNVENGRRHLAGVMRYMTERADWNAFVVNNVGYHDLDKMSLLDGARFSGAVLAHDTEDRIFARMLSADIPIVVTNSDFVAAMSNGRTNFASVLTDAGEIGRCAAAHFRKLGQFASFGFVHNRTCARWSRDREAAFRASLPKNVVYSTFNGDSVAELDADKIAAWLETIPKPAALLAANDFVGALVLSACKAAQLDVPKSVCVLGVDNDSLLCRISRPHLSSIEQPSEIAGWRAAQLLDRMMLHRQATPRAVQVRGAKVVTRDSTAFMPPAAQLVSRAEDFIRQHACDGIFARDVIANMRVSRSLLNLRFRQRTGKSIQQAILDRRLERVRELLATTRQSISSIARAAGFNSDAHLKRLFRARHGASMREWRASCTRLRERVDRETFSSRQ